MKIKLVAAALALVCTHTIMAQSDKGGLFVEPMLTYENLNSDVNYPSPFDNNEGDSDGLGIGLRLGAHVYESVFLGVDGRFSKLEYNSENDNYNPDADTYNYGVVLGAQLPTPISLRVWGGYILGSEFDPELKDDLDVKFESGSGYRFGAGIMLAMISLNLEYQKIKYDKAILEQIGPFTPNENFDDVELENDGYVLSVSFPFSF